MHDTLTFSELAPDNLTGAPVTTVARCYGCTAGQGSSYGGALEAKQP